MTNEIQNNEVSGFAFNPKNLEEALKCCKMLSESDMVPKDYKGKPGNVLVAIQMGIEVGLKPLQALQNIAVINGRPSMWGDAIVAIVRASGTLDYLNETWDEKTQTATCVGRRKGEPSDIIRSFSMEDAKKAGLFERKGTWETYPKRMAGWRAKSWVLRDGWSDFLKGISIREEVEYIEPSSVVIPEPKRLTENAPMPELENLNHSEPVTEPESEPSTDHHEPQETKGEGIISDKQRNRLYAILCAGTKTEEERKGRINELKNYMVEMYQIDSTKKVLTKYYEAIVKVAENISKGE
jgi:hypothetical protein